MPHTAFFADGLPDPTGGAVLLWLPPVARAVATSATTRQAAREIPPNNFLDLILPPLPRRLAPSFVAGSLCRPAEQTPQQFGY
jgi:hypothetical protein